jgi:hypothetical protein
LVNQGQFLLHVGNRLSVAVSLIKVRAQQLKKKLVVEGQIFSFTVDCGSLYWPWGDPVFDTEARMVIVV